MSDSDNSPLASQQQDIQFERAWAMPNKDTFSIAPIRKFVAEEIDDSPGLWIDPFSGGTEFADITNDLNPEIESDKTMQATEFLAEFGAGEVDGGVLMDPPYSPRQIKECYDSVGLEVTTETTQASFWSDAKREIERVCDSGASVVSCGWNSGGVGRGRGFEIRRILMVAHGGNHNDTIVTAEDCTRRKLSEFGVEA